MHIYLSFLALAFTLLGVPSGLTFVSASTFQGSYRNVSCIDSEKQALLLLKESLVDDLNYLSSWTGDDCCAWHGIGCNNRTGHVIQLDLRNSSLKGDHIYPSLLDLKYLTYLDLSNNNFSQMKIPQFFGSFKDLTYLNLSYSYFEGLVPHHLGNLSKLMYLDLSNNYYFNGLAFNYYDNFNLFLSIDSMRWLSGAPLLKHLDLSFVNLSTATDWFPSINMLSNSISVLQLRTCQLPNNIPRHVPLLNLTSLVTLDIGSNQLNSSFPLWLLNNSGLAHLNLQANHFNGPIPDLIGNLTSLFELRLDGNNFNGSIPESVWRLISLSSLDFSYNQFQGSLPESIGRLTSLTSLILGANNLEGVIPKLIGNLTSISVLDLSYNNFQGLIPEFIGTMTSLTYLALSDNNFRGFIPPSIGNLTSLSTFSLSSNNLRGSIPPKMSNLTELTELWMDENELRGGLPEAFCYLSNLRRLFVNNNQLTIIPKCIGQLSNLHTLQLSSNSWEGILSEHHFANLTNFRELYISTNSDLVLNVSAKWVPPFQLGYIYMESLNLGPKFPRWLQTQRQINYIVMINTSISDTFPADWFANLLSHAYQVDLSNNDIHGESSLISVASASSGMLQLALSNNGLTGEFPAILCNLTSLITLVLSNNNFSGELPQCLGNLKSLQDLDVMNNSLSGNIHVSLGFLRSLTYLNLHDNNFQGKLPLSFQNFKKLVILDLGKNNLSDSLPRWTVDQLPRLQFLILRSNKFYGELPTQLCHHPSIQVLNFAQNQIVGSIPLCFGNFSSMIIVNKSDDFNQKFAWTYSRMIIDDAKGYELKYTSTLTYLTSIDLSNNDISGEIPEELMNLQGLRSLNLAGNHLAGKIPDKIGKLKSLEYLNLSKNELYGHIPQSLSDLNFLSSLDLSFNDLSGRIPTGNQLQTLNDLSDYAGNNQLCGRPILKPCIGDTESHIVPDSNEGDSYLDDNRVWFNAGIGSGLMVGFLGFCASLHFIKSWGYFYFHLIDQVFNKIGVAFASLRRKFQN
ncbi:uncharacterized protein LOC141674580 [Apium graveolens]|uniref:uncharacterized protein LOC141674580 n=1 Tax=Apium graveolens TaxID=4045 RepID=UPI003D7BC1DE